jgi:two-component system OmpR family response regulator
MEAAFQRIGYSVRCSTDDRTVDALVRSFEPDVMIIDSRHAFPQSSSLVLHVRRCPDILTIAIGADSEDQRIAVMRSGIDDAVPTGASIAVRCQAILRRMRHVRSASAIELGRILSFGPLCVDLGRREIRVDQSVIAATRLEFELFAQLCRRPLEVCSRAELLKSVWGPHWVGDTHVVDVHMSNLRRKFTSRNPHVQFMQTVRGVGFRLADDILYLASKDVTSRRMFGARLSWNSETMNDDMNDDLSDGVHDGEVDDD